MGNEYERNVAVQDLLSALLRNTVCRTLYASGHAMSPLSATRLSRLLAANRTLSSVCVGDAAFGDAGIAALSDMFEFWGLQHLDLENKGVGHEGLSALTRALAVNTLLETLNVSRNAIGDAGWVTLADTGDKLDDPIHVQRLQLSGCCIPGSALTGARRCAQCHQLRTHAAARLCFADLKKL